MPNPLINNQNRQNGGNSITGILQQFQNFRSTFTGDPKAKVQELLNSGKMTPDQLERLEAMASSYKGILF